jgi:hypothetical protein
LLAGSAYPGLVAAQQAQPAAPTQPGQAAQPAQAAKAPAVAPNKADAEPFVEALPATVTEVTGTVEWAKPGVSPLATEGWTPVKWKDKLEPGTQIRTGLRSSVHLQFGKTTLVAIRSATHASIDQIYKSAKTEHVRLGLGYGTVRGGSVEGTIRSDVVVDSPVATLAKRGTEGWEFRVEASTGRFRISLAEYGLVEAREKLSGAKALTRTVRPGEYATDANIANMWIKQDIFDRNIKFYEADAVTVSDAEFANENTRGYATLAPGGGSTVVDAAQRQNADFVLDQIGENYGRGGRDTTVLVPTGPVNRPEGNFGTGQTYKVLLPQKGRQIEPKFTRGPNLHRQGR